LSTGIFAALPDFLAFRRSTAASSLFQRAASESMPAAATVTVAIQIAFDLISAKAWRHL
jgi:hypothetical protein